METKGGVANLVQLLLSREDSVRRNVTGAIANLSLQPALYAFHSLCLSRLTKVYTKMGCHSFEGCNSAPRDLCARGRGDRAKRIVHAG